MRLLDFKQSKDLKKYKPLTLCLRYKDPHSNTLSSLSFNFLKSLFTFSSTNFHLQVCETSFYFHLLMKPTPMRFCKNRRSHPSFRAKDRAGQLVQGHEMRKGRGPVVVEATTRGKNTYKMGNTCLRGREGGQDTHGICRGSLGFRFHLPLFSPAYYCYPYPSQHFHHQHLLYNLTPSRQQATPHGNSYYSSGERGRR